jgi:DNA-binding transcriptional ArsR family regulator
MFTLHLDARDLATARFRVSPLHETVASLWCVYGGQTPQVHRRWASRVSSHPGLDHELLTSLVSQRGWIPDFIAPVPLAASPDITHQLAQVRATPPGKVIEDVVSAYGPHPVPSRLRDVGRDPCGFRDQVASALARYWRAALAPHWPRARVLLDADLMFRGLQLATGGAESAFGQLDRRIRWSDGVLAVDIIREWHRDVPVAGRGFHLVPSLFVPFPQLPIDANDPPVLTYPARGAALLPRDPRLTSGGAVEDLLGRPRARVLSLLENPASTTELAQRLGVTPSAVSQHLRVLRATGLLSSARVGRVVLYWRSELGVRIVSRDQEE